MSAAVLRRLQLTLVWAGVLVAVLCALLVVAAWRDDRAIEAHMGTATADVLSAGATRSTISFYTSDGVNHNPPLGVLYPSELTVGDRIQVQYDVQQPELVRVAGRTAAVAVVPAASVAVGTWLVIGAVMVALAQTRRRNSSPDVRHEVSS
ncbi:DUF3592 domain-containing protein [Tsukamurella sp. 8F]|uniref:DUF3592 domain-containing protein n=1 Tax=unclassified Tsukamurella TaxID=2633480 RepID=UPI0023B9F901|nr:MULTISPECIES: DUF3592 domain-containing protein [unclassified Tsukamurella]MDF0531632.1 DUF3592 domain-containing protein [Tsukamurella sp. 8J]MDF0588800.1 DUF3592 domain-containing protein [Tsukamurella sp. 8F]